jgi:hypothetical protein
VAGGRVPSERPALAPSNRPKGAARWVRLRAWRRGERPRVPLLESVSRPAAARWSCANGKVWRRRGRDREVRPRGQPRDRALRARPRAARARSRPSCARAGLGGPGSRMQQGRDGRFAWSGGSYQPACLPQDTAPWTRTRLWRKSSEPPILRPGGPRTTCLVSALDPEAVRNLHSGIGLTVQGPAE